MAGNTRGKLKENFEGIHRNFDWSLHHINKSLRLIAEQLFIQAGKDIKVATPEQISEVAGDYPLYKGIKVLGEGIQALDEFAQKIYATL